MQKMPINKYLCRLSRDMDQRGLSGMENMTRSVRTLILEIAVPVKEVFESAFESMELAMTGEFLIVQLL